MNIDNNPFDGFTIEFKEINPTDFNDNFIVDDKVIIEPNEDGYINEVLQSNISLDTKNTVVINAAVGQGKSFAIIKTIKRYYEKDEKYLIIVASPFVSLVKQYCMDIHKDAGIPTSEIFNYNELGRNPNASYIGKSIQVLTVNTLLGNPGQDGFKNSDIKRKYLNEITKYCQETETKVIFIYDEIHDSYQNFREEYIFNLWKWKNVIHKNFIISATYNEASKVVIEYLAELTDKKIKIIESKRIRFEDKQSTLYLYYSPSYWFKPSTPEVKQTIKKLIQKGKNLDILCYSKNLANKIIDTKGELGQLLQETYGEVKDCTSELISRQRPDDNEPRNQFDNRFCNIGTNFKTGVSIKKENHAYLIIMPPRATKLWFRNRYGIFSGGVNSVIQALARQRLKGEIHIVLSNPNEFDYASLDSNMSSFQKRWFEDIYSKIKYFKTPKHLVKYCSFNHQDTLLQEFYNAELYGDVEDEITYINSLDRENLPNLKFPSYKQFKLEKGEMYLANDKKNSFFGEDISAYISYSALTNQFINCTLKRIYHKPTLFFQNGKIIKSLMYYYFTYFGEEHLSTVRDWNNFSMFYNDIRDNLFNSYNLRYKNKEDEKWKTIKSYSIGTKEFEIQLLNFTAKIYYGDSYNYRYELSGNEDFTYTRGMYFLDNISLCSLVDSEAENYSFEAKNKIKLYKIIEHFRQKLIEGIKENKSEGLHFFSLKRTMSGDFFNSEDKALFTEIARLIKYDELLDNNIFNFKRDLSLGSLYTKLIQDFFDTEEYKTPALIDSERPLARKILSYRLPPFSKRLINLIEPKMSYYDEILPEIEKFSIEKYGNPYEYQTVLNSIFTTTYEDE